MEDLSKLPHQSVPLTQEGINRLFVKFNETPSLGDEALKALRENPRRTLYRLFELSAIQKSIIQNMNDADLHRYIDKVLGVKFGSAKPPTVKFDPDPVFAGVKAIPDDLDVKPLLSCHCHIST
jgi:hypothetical protein